MATGIFTCRNHPTLRWTKTKCGPNFMGRGVLMFDGEEGGLPANPILVLTESSLAERTQAFQAHYREHYAVECSCPFRDLVPIEMRPSHPDERPFAPWRRKRDGTWAIGMKQVNGSWVRCAFSEAHKYV